MKTIVVLAAILLAQAPARPAFEAASVKRNTTGPRGLSNVLLAGGRYVGSGPTVRSMTVFAYAPLLTRQVVGGPDWLDTERYDVQAKADGNPSGDTLRKMLQELLADRFKLRTHTEKRDSAAYFLVRARPDRLGPQLKPGTVNCTDHQGSAPPPDAVPPTLPPLECGFRTSTRNFADAGIQIVNAGKGVTIAQLAAQLSTFGPVGRLVIDRTGLTSAYDVEVSFSAGSSGAPSAVAVSIFTALQEQLGLKLESTTAPVDFLVIDGAERPTED